MKTVIAVIFITITILCNCYTKYYCVPRDKFHFDPLLYCKQQIDLAFSTKNRYTLNLVSDPQITVGFEQPPVKPPIT